MWNFDEHQYIFTIDRQDELNHGGHRGHGGGSREGNEERGVVAHRARTEPEECPGARPETPNPKPETRFSLRVLCVLRGSYHRRRCHLDAGCAAAGTNFKSALSDRLPSA